MTQQFHPGQKVRVSTRLGLKWNPDFVPMGSVGTIDSIDEEPCLYRYHVAFEGYPDDLWPCADCEIEPAPE